MKLLVSYLMTLLGTILVTTSSNLMTIHQKTSLDFQIVLSKMLQELLNGPLAEKTITLYFDEEVERRVRISDVIANLPVPIFLWANLEQRNNQPPCTEVNTELATNYTNCFEPDFDEDLNEELLVDEEFKTQSRDGTLRVEFQFESVLVYITGHDDPEAVLVPESSWIMSGLVIISMNENCEANALLQAKLAGHTGAVVLMCPVVSNPTIRNHKTSMNSRIISSKKQIPVALRPFPLGKQAHIAPKPISRSILFPGTLRKISSDKHGPVVPIPVSGSKQPPLSNRPTQRNTQSSAAFKPILGAKHYPAAKLTRRNKSAVVFRAYTWRPFEFSNNLLFLGQWSLSRFPKWGDLFVDRFPSFRGAILHVSSDEEDMPFVFRRSPGSRSQNFGGSSKRILDAIGYWLDFDFTMTKWASDYNWGELVNGSWNGLLGEIYKGEKHLAINYFTVTEDRKQYFDVSVSYHNEGFGFVVKVPPPLPRWMNLVYPFTMDVWLGVMATLLIATTVFYLFPHRYSPTDSFIVIAKSLINQGVGKLPPKIVLRAYMAIWWLAGYVVVISYTCNLIAVLTVPVYPSKIKTLSELVQRGHRICMMDYGEFVPDALRTSRDPDLHSLGWRMDLLPVDETEYYGQLGCIDLVLKGSHAHLETYSYVQLLYEVLDHGTEIYHIKEQLYKANLVFFFRKNTPWKYKFDWGMQSLLEFGLVTKWYQEVMRNLTKNSQTQTESADLALSLGHLQGPFYILILSTVLATALFVVEYMSKTRKME